MENTDPNAGESVPAGAPAGTPAPVAEPKVNGDAPQGGDNNAPSKGAWYEALPADYKENPSITKFKSVEDLSKSYLEIQKMVGKDKVVVPNEKSSKEEWEQFYTKAGRPADVKGYELPKLEVAPELQKSMEANLDAFKSKALELGLSKKQFAEMYGLSVEVNQNAFNQFLETQLQGKQTTATELRKEFGAAFEVKQDLAQKVVNTFFTDPEAAKVVQNHLLSNAGFAKAMMKIGESLGEDVIAGKPREFTLTPAAAESEYNALLNNKAFYDEFNPERKAMVDRSIELLQMMEAGKK
jgi:hypothetical protein